MSSQEVHQMSILKGMDSMDREKIEELLRKEVSGNSGTESTSTEELNPPIGSMVARNCCPAVHDPFLFRI